MKSIKGQVNTSGSTTQDLGVVRGSWEHQSDLYQYCIEITAGIHTRVPLCQSESSLMTGLIVSFPHPTPLKTVIMAFSLRDGERTWSCCFEHEEIMYLSISCPIVALSVLRMPVSNEYVCCGCKHFKILKINGVILNIDLSCYLCECCSRGVLHSRPPK